MHRSAEFPKFAELSELPIDLSRGDEPWVVVASVSASDGDELVYTWDEVALSVFVRWESRSGQRLALSREAIEKVSVSAEGSVITIVARTSSAELRGELVVTVDEHVRVRDTLLQS